MEQKIVSDKREKVQKKNFDIKNIFNRLKKIKHIEIVIAVVIIVAVIGIYFGTKGVAGTADTNTKLSNSTQTNYDYSGVEAKLEQVLGTISGVGKVTAMITYNGSSEVITAVSSVTSSDKTTDTGSGRVSESNNKTTSPVMVNQSGQTSPVVVKEVYPDVRGVVIIAEGAENIAVRLNLLKAVQTVLNVPADKVEIFAMKRA